MDSIMMKNEPTKKIKVGLRFGTLLIVGCGALIGIIEGSNLAWFLGGMVFIEIVREAKTRVK